jgi:hypothetical protein
MKNENTFTRGESQQTVRRIERKNATSKIEMGGILAHDYTFEVGITAVVRVRAPNERFAREVATSALGSPSSEEIRLANEGNFLLGRKGTIIEVDFLVEGEANRRPSHS